MDPLKYQKPGKKSFSNEILTVKFRYKAQGKDKSELIVHPVENNIIGMDNTSENFRFAASVADFAMLLRNSKYKGNSSFEEVISLAGASLGQDNEGYRKEFLGLVKKAEKLKNAIAQNTLY